MLLFSNLHAIPDLYDFLSFCVCPYNVHNIKVFLSVFILYSESQFLSDVT